MQLRAAQSKERDTHARAHTHNGATSERLGPDGIKRRLGFGRSLTGSEDASRPMNVYLSWNSYSWRPGRDESTESVGIAQ